jgi:hypothetical protein
MIQQDYLRVYIDSILFVKDIYHEYHFISTVSNKVNKIHIDNCQIQKLITMTHITDLNLFLKKRMVS